MLANLASHLKTKKHRLFSKTRTEFDDPFAFIKEVFVDGGYHIAAKWINFFCLVIHTISLLLEIIFYFRNFTMEIFLQYGCGSSLMMYILACMYFSVKQESNAYEIIEDIMSSFWPINICGSKIKQDLLNQAKKVNRINYIFLVSFGMALLTLCPFWGDQKEWILCIQIYRHYFGKWAIIIYYIYCSTVPWLAFATIRFNFMIIYAIVHIRMQVYLINQQIAEVSVLYEDISKIDDLAYQDNVFKKLRLCISHHVMLKKWMNKVLDKIRMGMPVFVVLGVLTSISVLFYVAYSFQDANLIGKIRVGSLAYCTCLAVYLFCEGGQSIINKTNNIFDILGTCPWYIWSIRNRKILSVFMTNSLNPLSFSMAGVTIDYIFALSVLRTSCSYALVLYNLNKMQQEENAY